MAQVQIPTKTGTPMRSPMRSPTKRQGGITQAQKQALIDNLQLEVTERARKLRAQYTLQAQSLRTRLEIRIHRIPTALRKTKISDLLEKHTDKPPGPESRGAKPVAITKTVRTATTVPPTLRSPIKAMKPLPALEPVTRGTKRSSNEMEDHDKENATVEGPKKRARGPTSSQAPTTIATARPASPRLDTGKVLSPRSANSRTPPPRSPYKPSFSPVKSNIARPTSPLKSAPYVAQPTAASLAKTTEKPLPRTTGSRAASRQAQAPTIAAIAAPTRGKRTIPSTATTIVTVASGEPVARLSDVSNATSASTATTVVTKSKRAAAAAAATITVPVVVTKTKKGGIVGKLASMGTKAKKAATAAVSNTTAATTAAESQSVGRVLRKRG